MIKSTADILDIETAIKMHIENQRKWIHPSNNPVIIQKVELHFRTIEKAPRDSKTLLNQITKKKQQLKEATQRVMTDKLCIELEALQWLYHLVKRSEGGLPLDGLAF
jgi:hypothetical protein